MDEHYRRQLSASSFPLCQSHFTQKLLWPLTSMLWHYVTLRKTVLTCAKYRAKIQREHITALRAQIRNRRGSHDNNTLTERSALKEHLTLPESIRVSGACCPLEGEESRARYLPLTLCPVDESLSGLAAAPAIVSKRTASSSIEPLYGLAARRRGSHFFPVCACPLSLDRLVAGVRTSGSTFGLDLPISVRILTGHYFATNRSGFAMSCVNRRTDPAPCFKSVTSRRAAGHSAGTLPRP